MRQKVVKIGDKTVSYWDNGTKNYKKAIVLFPPGASSGKRFIKHEKLFSKDARLVFPDYLGRGGSSGFEGDNIIKKQAEIILSLINKLKLKNVTLVGISYGTAVVNELCKTGCKNITKINLVAPGEFYTPTFRLILKILFYPAKYSSVVRKVYKQIVNLFSPGLVLEGMRLKDILYQWLDVLDYRVDDSLAINIETVIYIMKKDKVVDKSSLNKIVNIYRNSSIKYYNTGHPTPGVEMDKLFRKIYKLF